MGSPASEQEPLPLFDERLVAPEWPEELPTFHISRERFKSIGHSPTDPALGFRVQSFNRLGYLYGVDKLGIRDKILKEFGYKVGEDDELYPPAVIGELGINADPASGLDFSRNPFKDDLKIEYCPPQELDLLDVKSMCVFTKDVLKLVRQGRNWQEQRDILVWKTGKRTAPKMVEHWTRAGRVLIVAASNIPELDS